LASRGPLRLCFRARSLQKTFPLARLPSVSTAVSRNGRVSAASPVTAIRAPSIPASASAAPPLSGLRRRRGQWPPIRGPAEIRENAETTAEAGASSETLYVLREFGYLGLPKAGLVRFGQLEGALYLVDTGPARRATRLSTCKGSVQAASALSMILRKLKA
jgi:hypothetical protein